MYNIQKAVSRLDFAPKLKEIEVTDFKKGLGVFTPKPDKPVSFAALKEALKKAGYTLSAADITVTGTLAKDDKGWVIVLPGSGQRIALAGPNVDQLLAGAKSGETIELSGDWKTVNAGPTAHEAIHPTPKTTNETSPLFGRSDTWPRQLRFPRQVRNRSLLRRHKLCVRKELRFPLEVEELECTKRLDRRSGD